MKHPGICVRATIVLTLLTATLGALQAQTPPSDQEAIEILVRLTSLIQSNDPCAHSAQISSLFNRLVGFDPDNRQLQPAIDLALEDCRTGAQPTAVAPPTQPPAPRPTQVNTSPQPSPAQLRYAREQAAIQQSITRVSLKTEIITKLIELALQYGHEHFERRKGSILDHTNRHDDAEADSRGFRKRDSDNFIVYYRTGDMNRAKATLQFAEEARPRMLEVFHHFPTAQANNGQKLPIYLSPTHEDYVQLSDCSERSLACVKYIAYDDGLKSTMYVSVRSYERGVDEYRKVVIHEITHYTQNDLISPDNVVNLRPWVKEGIASYAAGESERLLSLKRAYEAGEVIPLQTLSQVVQRSDSATDLLLYSQGYSVMQLLDQEFGIATLTDFLLAVSQKTTIEGAAREVLNLGLDSLDWQWMRHLGSMFGYSPLYTWGAEPKGNNQDPQEQFELAFRAGAEALKNEDFRAATGAFAEATQLDPSKAGAWRALADVQWRLGYTNTGEARSKLLDESIASVRKAVSLLPENSEAHASLGLSLARTGKTDEAWPIVTRWAELGNPRRAAIVFFNFGLALQDQGKDEEAIDAFDRATELDPNYGLPYAYLALALVRSAEMRPDGTVVPLEGTVEALERYLELEPDGILVQAARLLVQALTSKITTRQAASFTPTSGAEIIRIRNGRLKQTHQVKPAYPELARLARVQGHVNFRVLIGTDGAVKEAEAIEGHPLLVPAALDAVKQWRYEPIQLGDKLVENETTVAVNFTLSAEN